MTHQENTVKQKRSKNLSQPLSIKPAPNSTTLGTRADTCIHLEADGLHGRELGHHSDVAVVLLLHHAVDGLPEERGQEPQFGEPVQDVH